MTYEVLIPVDENRERAIGACEVAANLPEAPDTVEAVILNVQEEVQVSGEYGRVDSETLYDEDNYPESAKEGYDYLKDRGIATSLRREHGDPVEEIINVAEEIEADMTVIGGRKRSPVGKLVFGSVTQDVLLKSERPVTIISVSKA